MVTVSYAGPPALPTYSTKRWPPALFKRGRIKRWQTRAQPYLDAFYAALAAGDAATADNLVAVGDQVSAATRDLAAYLAADPPPTQELAAAWNTIAATANRLAGILQRWNVMLGFERKAAIVDLDICNVLVEDARQVIDR